MKTRLRKPTSPGEILKEEFLKPLKLDQTQLAKHIGCDFKVINRIVNEKSAITPDIALKLGAAFQTSADFWLNAQKAVDLYRAQERLRSRHEELPEPISTSDDEDEDTTSWAEKGA